MITDQFDPATVVRILQVAATKVNALLALALVVTIYVVLDLNEADFIRGCVRL